MSAHPPDGSDEPEAVDPVMLAVLSNRGKEATPLSADQEGLLDDWVARRLAPEPSALAADGVLERRLLEAARQSPTVPQGLTARVLKANPPPKASPSSGGWRPLGRWQWTAIAGALALAAIVAGVGGAVSQENTAGG